MNLGTLSPAMFGFGSAPEAEPAFPLPDLLKLDAYPLYATCLLALLVLNALVGTMRRARVRVAAARGKGAQFVPLLGKDAPAPPGSKGKAVVVGGGCARRRRPRRARAAPIAAALVSR